MLALPIILLEVRVGGVPVLALAVVLAFLTQWGAFIPT